MRMVPPLGANSLGCPQSGQLSPADAVFTNDAEALGDTRRLSVEAFIWPDHERELDDACTASPRDEPSESQQGPHIVVLSEDVTVDETGHDAWRRQLISALQDADREPDTAPLSPLSTTDLPYRRPPRHFAPRRPMAVQPVGPASRAQRPRMSLSMMAALTAGGLLTMAVPHAANAPEQGRAASAQPVVLAGLHSVVTNAGAEMPPPMFNTPVLVREGQSITPRAPLALNPVIQTIRTVPVQMGPDARPLAMIVPTASEGVSMPGMAERDASARRELGAPVPQRLAGLALLPPPRPVVDPPGPRTAEIEPASQPVAVAAAAMPAAQVLPAAQPLPRRAPQRPPTMKGSLTTASPRPMQNAARQVRRTEPKTAARAQKADWEARRQGLSKAPETPSPFSNLFSWLFQPPAAEVD